MRPSAASPSWNILLGVLIPIVTALIMAAGRNAMAGKLDVARFERDSISNAYQHQIDHALLLRIDSSTRLSASALRQLQDRTLAGGGR